MTTTTENYVTIREMMGKRVLTEKDCVYAVYLLSIVLNKMCYESKGGGHFNVNPDTAMIYKKDGEDVKVKLMGDDMPHEDCSGSPSFDTSGINPCFRAPETYLGRFSSASDVYSLGMLLAYMLQGKYPFDINEGMGKEEIAKIIRTGKPQLDVPEKLKPILKKAMSRKVSGRYDTAKELGMALTDYLGMEKPKNFECFKDDNKEKAERANKKMNEDNKDKMDEMTSTAKEPRLNVDMGVKTGDGFKAVAGMNDLKRQLRRDFVEIVSHRDLAAQFGIAPSNMLFYGPPGVGKTFISRQLASECGLEVCYVKPSDLGSIWVHGSQGLIKQLFDKAEAAAKKNKKGCLLLVDEIDSLCGDRSQKGNEHQADEVAEWLTQLNDCVEKNVFVIGTTNRLDHIDKAITRHGRLDCVVYIGMPDLECREQLFGLELNKRPHEDGIDCKELARLTDGYTSSDISYMVKETARNAFEACLGTEDKHLVKITQEMLTKVISNTRPSVTPSDVKMYERMRDEYVRTAKEERPRIGFVR